MQINPYSYATGTAAGTATIATLTAPFATAWTFIIDGVAGTGVGTVAIEVLPVVGGTAQPITTPAWNAFSVTGTTTFMLNWTGPLLTASLVVTAFTSGTIRGTILAN